MGFRDQMVAAQVRADVLRAEVERATARALAAETERDRLAGELDRVRRGASVEQTLRDDPHFTIAQVLMPVAGLLGLLYAFALRHLVFRDVFYGSFDPTPRGIRNFLRQLDSPEAVLSSLLVAATVLLALLPLLAAVGLLRRRKWGWAIGTVTYLLWLFFLPPLGIYGLYALCRGAIVGAFFRRPAPEAAPPARGHGAHPAAPSAAPP
ncbi:MAG TPA: hypothetical protein RMH99_31210, partial [Sandaracinaceae bacterium LLY-WYZ-13_1]|nr:hypothetical protein [Sandaracinaceae bacterium LLY-WYZ-13_1]